MTEERRRRKVNFGPGSIATLEVTDQFAARCRFGVIEEANTAAARYLGLEAPEAMLGRPLLDFVARDYQLVTEELLALRVIELSPWPLLVLLPDGGSREAEIKIHPARELGEGVTIVTLRDLTEQSRLARQARRMDMMFHRLVDNAMHMICRCQGDHTLYVNPAGLEMIGHARAGTDLSVPVWSFFEEPYRSLFRNDLSALLDEPGIVPVRFRRVDGEAIDVQVRVTRLPESAGGFMLEARDITVQNRAVSALRAMNETLEKRVAERTSELAIQKGFLERLLTAMPNPVWWKDVGGHYRGFNQAFATLLKASEERWIGRRIEEVSPGEYVAMSKLRDEQALSGPPIAYEMEVAADDGARQFLVNKTAWLDESRQPAGVIGVMIDISQQKKLENQLRKLATTDALTGVFNRRHFMEGAAEMVSVAQRHGRPLAVMMLDIDHFKRINDTFGHPVGDEAIKALADTCRRGLRNSDILGRLGGEEFALCLPETDLEGTLVLAERLREDIEQACLCTASGEVRFTVSVGVAEISPQDEGIGLLLARADRALYRAKNGGRNRVVADLGGDLLD